MSPLRTLVATFALALPISVWAQMPQSVDRSAGALTGRAPVPGAPAGVVAFVNVAVIPMDTERVVPNQTVLVAGGRITALGPATKVSVPAGATRIDGQGKYLIPGFADMHVHLGFRKNIDTAAAERVLFPYLAAGITTIRSMDWLVENANIQVRAWSAAGKLWSPRIYTAGAWGPKHYALSAEEQGSSPAVRLDSVAAYVAEYKAKGYDFIKVRTERPEVFDSVLAAARRIGIPVAGHVPNGVSLERAIAAGMHSIEHLTGFVEEKRMANGDFRLRSDRRELIGLTQRAGVWNCLTIMWTGISEGLPEMVKALQGAGAGLLLGTDAGYRADIPSAVDMELAGLVRLGLTPYQALATGTKNVAMYFGTLEESGTVAVGKRADLVLLDANPLENIQHTAQRGGVMIGGRWLSREEIDRRITTLKSSIKQKTKPPTPATP